LVSRTPFDLVTQAAGPNGGRQGAERQSVNQSQLP
jgi:hypothetical protein